VLNPKNHNRYYILAIFSFGLLLCFGNLVKAGAPSIISSDAISPYSAGSTHSVVLNKPSGLRNGDMLIAIIQHRRADPNPMAIINITTTAPSGWTKLQENKILSTAALGANYIAYKVISDLGSESSTYSFGLSTSPASVLVGDAAIIHVRNGASAFADGSYQTKVHLTSMEALTAPSVTSQGDSLWLISGLGTSWSGNTVPSASPSGFTNLEYNNDGSTAYLAFSLDYKTVGAGATGTAVYSRTGSGSSAGTTSLAICGGGTPVATAYYPSGTQIHVPRVSSLTLTLSETVTKGTGNIYIKRYSDDSTLLTIPVGSSNVVVESNIVRIRLLSCIAAGQQVYVTIDSGAFEGPCGLDYLGISHKDTWKFYLTRICNQFFNEV
jgi:hypothetical protein